MNTFTILFNNRVFDDRVGAHYVDFTITEAWLKGYLGDDAKDAINNLEIVRGTDAHDSFCNNEIALGWANAEGFIDMDYDSPLTEEQVKDVYDYLLEALGANCTIEVDKHTIRVTAQTRKFVAYPNKHLSHAHRYEQAFMDADCAIREDSQEINNAFEDIINLYIDEDHICTRYETLNNDLDEGLHYDYCILNLDNITIERETEEVTFTLASGEEFDEFDMIHPRYIEDRFNKWSTVECEDLTREGNNVRFLISYTHKDNIDAFNRALEERVQETYHIASVDVE